MAWRKFVLNSNQVKPYQEMKGGRKKMKKLFGIVLAVILSCALLVPMTSTQVSAANMSGSEYFGPGDEIVLAYNAATNVDLTIEITDSDGYLDDDVDVFVDGHLVLQLLAGDGTVSTTLSLPAGDYEVVIDYVDYVDSPGTSLDYDLTEAAYTGDFIPDWLAVDLALIKTGPADVIAGELFSYDITVINYGPITATNVKVTDLLPGIVDYVTSGIPNTGIPGIPQFELGDMAPGETRSFTMVVEIDPGLISGPTGITNYAGVMADQEDYYYANNEDSATTTVLEEADLKITKDIKPDGTVLAGEEAVCTIFIDNLGPSTARDVTLTDEFLSRRIFKQRNFRFR